MLRPVLRAALAAVAFVSFSGTAFAVPFASDVSIVGTSYYDTTYVQEVGVANVEGSIFDTVVGLTSGSAFNGNMIVGANPRFGQLTDVGDEVGLGAVGLASTDGSFQATADLGLSISNDSLTDVFQVEIEVAFANRLFATGQTAWIESNFVIGDSLGGVVQSAISSSTVRGNTYNGSLIDGFGGLVEDGRVLGLTYTLDPGESVDVVGQWAFGGAVLGDEALVALDAFGASFKIGSVTSVGTVSGQPVPEPTAALVFGLGLATVAGIRRRS